MTGNDLIAYFIVGILAVCVAVSVVMFVKSVRRDR